MEEVTQGIIQNRMNMANKIYNIEKAQNLGEGQEGEVRTWANGKKFKKQNGKWIPVSGGNAPKKKEQPKASMKKKDEEPKSKNNAPKEEKAISKQETSTLKLLKKTVESGDYKKAAEIAGSLSDNAKEIIPQKIWDKIVESSFSKEGEEEEEFDMGVFDDFEKTMQTNEFADLADEFFSRYDDNLKNLSTKENEALSKYRDSGYTAINKLLRDDIPEGWKEKNPDKVKQLDDYANKVSAVINKSELKEDVVAYRGVEASRNKELANFFSNLQVGDTYEDDGFSSTTLDKDVAEGKFSPVEGKGANIKILIPKGSKALPMQNVGDNNIQEAYDDEFEVLLDRGSKFEVIEKNGVDITVKLIQQ